MNKNLIKILGVFSVVIVLIIKVNMSYAYVEESKASRPIDDITELKYCPLFSSGNCDICNSGKSCDEDDDC